MLPGTGRSTGPVQSVCPEWPPARSAVVTAAGYVQSTCEQEGWVSKSSECGDDVCGYSISVIFLISSIPGVLLNILHVALGRRAHKEAIAHAAAVSHSRHQLSVSRTETLLARIS